MMLFRLPLPFTIVGLLSLAACTLKHPAGVDAHVDFRFLWPPGATPSYTSAISPIVAVQERTLFDTVPCHKLADVVLLHLEQYTDTLSVQRVLLAADFAYAFLSFELLQGYNYQKKEINEEDWFALNLLQQCQTEHQKTAGYTCGYRASFFQKFLSEMGYHQYFNASVPGKHTYTVVNAGTTDYPYWIIADAYDPFAVLDSSGNAQDVFTLLKNRSGNICRTKRYFGAAKALVKDSLIHDAAGTTPAEKLANTLNLLNQQLLAQGGKTVSEYFALSTDTFFAAYPQLGYPFYLHQYGRADTFNLQHLFARHSYYFSPTVVVEIPHRLQTDEEVTKAAALFLTLCRAGK